MMRLGESDSRKEKGGIFDCLYAIWRWKIPLMLCYVLLALVGLLGRWDLGGERII